MRKIPPLLILAVLAAPTTASAATPAFAAGLLAADMNGDGFDELPIGIPGEDVGTILDGGSFQLLFGGSAGLTDAGNLLWSQGDGVLRGVAEGGDELGRSVAAGDLNGDGRADLVVGAPGEDVGSAPDAGSIHVLYSRSSGPTGRNRVLHQNSRRVGEVAEPGDRLGASVAIADFDKDGFEDVAAGVPGEKIAGFDGAGAVHVFYGGPRGISARRDHVVSLATRNVPNGPTAGDEFGFSLAVGNFNTGVRPDLAAGIPGRKVAGAEDAGAVAVLYSGQKGVARIGGQFVSQNTIGVPGDISAAERFGTSVAAGELGFGKPDDLAVGVPGDDVGAIDHAGGVNVLYGGKNGLTATNSQLWNEDTTGVPGDAAAIDEMGGGLAAADFGGTGEADLAIGVPGQTSGSGAVLVLFGGASGVSAGGAQRWTQGMGAVPGTPEDGDRFGQSLLAGHFSGGQADLAVGTPGEDGIGAVNVLYGAAAGLTDVGAQRWDQDTGALAGTAEAGDSFGTFASWKTG